MIFSSKKSSKNKKKEISQTGGEPQKSRGLGQLFNKKNQDTVMVSDKDLHAGMKRALRPSKIISKDQEETDRDDASARAALTAIEAVLYAIDKGLDIITQATEVTASAKLTEELGARALLAESYDELRLALGLIDNECAESEITLLGHNGQSLQIEMAGKARYCVPNLRMDNTPGGLALSPPVNAFEDNEEIGACLIQLKTASEKLERASASYCRDAKYIMSRLTESTKTELSQPMADEDAA